MKVLHNFVIVLFADRLNLIGKDQKRKIDFHPLLLRAFKYGKKREGKYQVERRDHPKKF